VRSFGNEGVLAFNIDKQKIRFVTHYGITEDDIEYSIEKIGLVLNKLLGLK
jgi:threonine aldolase